MKYLFLIGRNFLRRKTRTTLTFLSIFVTFVLFGILMMLRVAFTGGVEIAGADRLMMTNKVSIIQPLLLSYNERIKATPRRPGVDDIRIPSERAFHSRERALHEGLEIDRVVFDALVALRAR